MANKLKVNGMLGKIINEAQKQSGLKDFVDIPDNYFFANIRT